jgi:hypothetical protein
VEELQARVEVASQPLTGERREALSREVRDLRRRILAAAESGGIAADRRETLLAGLRAVVRSLERQASGPAAPAADLQPTGV